MISTLYSLFANILIFQNVVKKVRQNVEYEYSNVIMHAGVRTFFWNTQNMYIPTGELHLHGHLDPASRRERATLTEADPVVTNC